jgi:hypothetical protein
MLKASAVLALASGLALTGLMPVRAEDAGSYNGTWTVELVTESGFCDGRHTYLVAVEGDKSAFSRPPTEPRGCPAALALTEPWA